MYDQVLINNVVYKVDYKKSVGIGGEAVVVKLQVPDNKKSGKITKALKLIKTADHPDLQGNTAAQEQARQLLHLHQHKLPAFPQGLPDQVITPEALAYDHSGRLIVGYLMRYIEQAELLIRYTQKSFRDQGVKTEDVIQMLLSLGKALSGVHQKNVIVGDLSELNVLVTQHRNPWLIDADSFGYKQWSPMAYTQRFVDPLLCDRRPGVKTLEPLKPQNKDSDWRIFTMLVMMCLIYVNPYDGVYDPSKSQDYVTDELRPLRRITIFHPEVIYPADLPHFSILPDDLLELFRKMFTEDWRGIFPLPLLENTRETTCKKCGKIHFRSLCPHCNQPAPAAVRQRVYTNRTVRAIEVMKTSGHVLYASLSHGVYRYLYHENGQYKRGLYRMERNGLGVKNTGISVTSGSLNPLRRYRILGDTILIAQEGQLLSIDPSGLQERTEVDSYGSLPLFDTNGTQLYWIDADTLVRQGDKLGDLRLPPRRIGSVLSEQTLFWVGKKFGFGFYRIGNLQVAFVFDAEQPGINDSVKLPQIRGQLIDSTCVFSDELCWFFVTTRVGGSTKNYGWVIHKNGSVESVAMIANSGDRGWLGTIRGKTALSYPERSTGRLRHVLFSPSTNGIVQLELEKDTVITVAEFPETAPFVDANTYLQIAAEGIYAAKDTVIHLLQLT